MIVALLAGALIVAGLWGGAELYKRARISERRADLFSSEAVTTRGEVIRVQRRGGGNDRRTTVHYRYVVGGRSHSGATTVRRQERDRYSTGSPVEIRYIASEPESSWMEGYAPRRAAIWPALAVPPACLLAAFLLMQLIRRQSHLLTYGRPAMAVVTKVEKKRSDKGTYWRVHYEWTLLSAAKRSGRYNHGRKQPPVVGQEIPIVYDRDEPARNGRYPLSFVAITGP
jgi:hypothetical protein